MQQKCRSSVYEAYVGPVKKFSSVAGKSCTFKRNMYISSSVVFDAECSWIIFGVFMATTFIVLGAGMQGRAAACDLGKFGDAEKIILCDAELKQAQSAAQELNRLLKTDLVSPLRLDVTDETATLDILQQGDVCLSAVPYFFNANLTKLAIQAGCHFCDLGGNTDVVFQQHAMHDDAVRAGVTVAPDCGLAPGMANILAAHGVRTLKQAKKAHIRVGGLPQHPKPPLGYSLFFSLEGLTNEYFGKAHILRGGRRMEVDTFTDLEEIHFPEPIGTCEAFMTAGGTSTCPWTFEGQLEEFDEKTIRYPGHYEKMKTVHDLGLLDLRPVRVGEQEVVPRQLFHAVVEPILKTGDKRDVVLLRVTVSGSGEQMVMELIDYYDDATGFTAMQRTTGFGAAIVGIMLARGTLPAGTIRLEQAIDTEAYIAAMRQRGFDLHLSTE